MNNRSHNRKVYALPRRNVVADTPLPTQNLYRAAISKIIGAIQIETDLTDEEMADRLHVSSGTIANARNKKADLSAVTLAKIGHQFGAEQLDRFGALYGARNISLEYGEESDALPSLAEAVHRLALAQSPTSPGGSQPSHIELLDMLPVLREAQQAINSLIVRAERVAA